MSDRINWVDHNGEKILIQDYSSLSGEKLIAEIGNAEKVILNSNEKHILTITDFTNARMSGNDRDRADQLMKNAKAKGINLITAAVGVTGIQRILCNTVVKGMYFAKDEQDAKKWLMKQADKVKQTVA